MYNIGDDVWVNHFNKPIHGVIARAMGDYYLVRVYQGNNGSVLRKHKDNVFRTKEELIKG